MRRLLNMNNDSNDSCFSILAALLKQPANGRTTNYEEMKRTVPLIDLLERNARTKQHQALIEEADFELLCERLKSPSSGFTRNSIEALQMIESVVTSEKVDVAQLSAVN